jgi:hypothetical protein
MALAPIAAAHQEPRFLGDVMCRDWIKRSDTVFVNPTWTLQAAWVKLHGAGDYTFAQQLSLSNAIRSAYAKTIDPKSLTAATTVQKVADWIPAAINA